MIVYGPSHRDSAVTSADRDSMATKDSNAASTKGATADSGQSAAVEESRGVIIARAIEDAKSRYIEADQRYAQGMSVVDKLRAERDTAKREFDRCLREQHAHNEALLSSTPRPT